MQKVPKLPDPTGSLSTEVGLLLPSDGCYGEGILMVIWLALTS